MADDRASGSFFLPACRELLDAHPESLRIREQVEALEEAMPDRPGVVVSFCRSIIETTCKTILTDRGVAVDAAWEAPKLVSESIRTSISPLATTVAWTPGCAAAQNPWCED